MDLGNSAPLVSPKPCRTPNSNRVKKINFQSDIPKSASNFANRRCNYQDLSIGKMKSFDCQESFKTSEKLFELNLDFEKKLEEDLVNDELANLINTSSSCSPNLTPNSVNSVGISFFNSWGSQDTAFSDELIRNSLPPNRTQNPFYKNFENNVKDKERNERNIDAVNSNGLYSPQYNFFDELSKCKSSDLSSNEYYSYFTSKNFNN